MGLELTSLTHAYGALKVLDDVSLTVESGELVCLLGPSGCGKTTTLRLAAGLEPMQQGSVSIGGQVVADPEKYLPPENRKIGYLFQDYALFPHLNISDNVAFGLEDMPVSERDGRIDEVLKLVGLSQRAEQYPHMLSGGQQQRVALARALANGPEIVLLDEPFSGLDAALRSQVRDQTLHILKKAGVATLMVTHDPEEAMFMADRIALMREGQIEQVGPPDQLYENPVSAFVTTFFGEINQVDSVIGRGKTVATPFGTVLTENGKKGDEVTVLIRPEGLRLSKVGVTPDSVVATVQTARFLGRGSLIHLKTKDGLHFHARMPGRFLPGEGEKVAVFINPAQSFVFPRNME